MERFTISASDGYPLGADFTTPNKRPRGLILINSAMGVRIRYYAAFASWLSTKGFLVFTYNYRGVGLSAPPKLKGFKASISDWALRDFEGITAHLANTYPGIPRMLIAHSIGGQILALSKAASQYRQILMISSGVGNLSSWSGWDRWRNSVFARVIIPVLTTSLGYLPAKKLGLFENIPAEVARQWADWIQQENYLFDKIPHAVQTAACLSTPIHSISFSDDKLAPKIAVDKLLERFTSSTLKNEYLRPENVGLKQVGHFGFFKNSASQGLWPKALRILENAL